jgi:hypothetical protein
VVVTKEHRCQWPRIAVAYAGSVPLYAERKLAALTEAGSKDALAWSGDLAEPVRVKLQYAFEDAVGFFSRSTIDRFVRERIERALGIRSAASVTATLESESNLDVIFTYLEAVYELLGAHHCCHSSSIIVRVQTR